MGFCIALLCRVASISAPIVIGHTGGLRIGGASAHPVITMRSLFSCFSPSGTLASSGARVMYLNSEQTSFLMQSVSLLGPATSGHAVRGELFAESSTSALGLL